METNKEDAKYLKAKKKVAKIKSFYGSLIKYVIFISLLAALNYYLNEWRNPWFLWAAFGWGIGLFFHGMNVFGWFTIFGKNWEDRKVKEYMEKEDEKRRQNL